MFFEGPLLATFSHSHTSENDDMSSKRTQGRVGSNQGAGKRRRAASTSLPLKSLCLNQESPLNLESIFNYLPTTARLNRNSWNAASFKQFKSKALATNPRSTSTSSPHHPPTVPTTSVTVSSLPTELLCLIFDSYSSVSPNDVAGDCAPDPETHPYGFFSVSRDCVRTPLPLTQVCQRWRSAAIGHKSLWGSISLALQGPVEEDEADAHRFHCWARGKTELLKLFLSRARGVPLSLALSSSEETPRCVVAEVLQLVCRHAGQWQDVRMDLGGVSAVEVLLDEVAASVARSPKSTFRLLRSLQLELAVDDAEDEYDEERMLRSRLAVKDVYELILRRSPNVSELVLDDLFFIWAEGGDYDICPSYERRCIDDDDGRDMVPWHQLKKLTINSNSISARKVLGTCAKAVRLEDLKLWRVGCDGASDVDIWDAPADMHMSSSPSATLTLPNLRSLDLTLVTETSHLLDALSTPSLRRIDIDVQALRNPLRTFDQLPVATILAPLNRLLDPISATVDIRCGVKLFCVSPEEGLNTPRIVDAAWMEAQGFHALARSRGLVDVYKYASARRSA